MPNPHCNHIIADLTAALRCTHNYLFRDITKLYNLRNKTSRVVIYYYTMKMCKILVNTKL